MRYNTNNTASTTTQVTVITGSKPIHVHVGGTQGLAGRDGATVPQLNATSIQYSNLQQSVSANTPLDATAKKVTHLDNAPVFGVSINSASAGATVTLVTHGIVQNSTWQFTPQSYVYIDDNDNLSHNTSTSGYVKCVGYAIDATTLYVDISPVVEL